MIVRLIMRAGLLTGLLLLIPLIAMQFSSEVQWGVMDFVFMGGLLFITGLAVEVIVQKVSRRNLRVALIAAVLVACLAVWAELAVGIFD